MTTMRDIAEHAGVSLSTVSHVVNETRYVSDDVRHRVLSAMVELDYRPNELARSLRRGQTNTIGLILPDSANPYFAEIGQSIELAAFENNFSVILCNTEGSVEREDLYVDVLRKKQVDGIIFVAAGERSDSVRDLIKRQFPVVLIDRQQPGIELAAVHVDNYSGGQEATQHLIDLGHTRVACITGPHNITPSADRVTGYLNALEEAGLPVDEQLIEPGTFRASSGYAATLKLLQLPDPPTAIFACNDMMAIGVLRAAAETGRRVPDDLAIVGFDDVELASYTIPPLTTVAQPTDEMGQKAVEMLLGAVKDKRHPRQSTILKAELVVRASSGGHK